MAHAGVLALDDEERPIRAQIEFTTDEMIVVLSSGPLGSWPLVYCRIEPDGDRFQLDVDGDIAWFRPDDPAAFAREALLRHQPGGLASAVKTARVASASPTPDQPPQVIADEAEDLRSITSWWGSLGDGQKNLILAGVGVCLGVLIVAGLAGRGSNPPTVTARPTPTTVAEQSTFQLDISEVSMRWNQVAADLRLDMFILGVPRGNRMEVELGRGIVLYATEDPATGQVRTLMIAAGPGQGEDAQAVLGAWGTLIAMVNPDLDPAQRRELLSRLGVDVGRPLQLGLRTETEQDGVRYWLRSGVLGGRVLLGVELLDSDPPE